MKRKSTISGSKLPGLKVTALELAHDGALKSGQLWKAGNFRKTMHQRYFVLRPSCYLFYFKNETDTSPAGVVEVVHYEPKPEEGIKDGESGYQYPFKIQNVSHPDKERVFHLEASSDAERKEWFAAFDRMRRLTEAMRNDTLVPDESKAAETKKEQAAADDGRRDDGTASPAQALLIAKLKAQLAEKTAALDAARSGTAPEGGDSGVGTGAGAGAGASEEADSAHAAVVASYKSQVASLEARLADMEHQLEAATSRAEASEATVKASVSAAAGDGMGAAQALAAKDAQLLAKDKEIRKLRTELTRARTASATHGVKLAQIASSLGGELEDTSDVGASLKELRSMAAAVQQELERFKAAHLASLSDGGTSTGAGAPAGAAAASETRAASKSVGGRLPGAEETKDDAQPASIRDRTKSVVTVSTLDKLPMPWFPDKLIAKCQMCNKDFGMFRRKHHCRRCGRCICASCAPDKLMKALPEFGFKQKVRHCVECYDLFLPR